MDHDIIGILAKKVVIPSFEKLEQVYLRLGGEKLPDQLDYIHDPLLFSKGVEPDFSKQFTEMLTRLRKQEVQVTESELRDAVQQACTEHAANAEFNHWIVQPDSLGRRRKKQVKVEDYYSRRPFERKYSTVLYNTASIAIMTNPDIRHLLKKEPVSDATLAIPYLRRRIQQDLGESVWFGSSLSLATEADRSEAYHRLRWMTAFGAIASTVESINLEVEYDLFRKISFGQKEFIYLKLQDLGEAESETQPPAELLEVILREFKPRMTYHQFKVLGHRARSLKPAALSIAKTQEVPTGRKYLPGSTIEEVDKGTLTQEYALPVHREEVELTEADFEGVGKSFKPAEGDLEGAEEAQREGTSTATMGPPTIEHVERVPESPFISMGEYTTAEATEALPPRSRTAETRAALRKESPVSEPRPPNYESGTSAPIAKEPEVITLDQRIVSLEEYTAQKAASPVPEAMLPVQEAIPFRTPSVEASLLTPRKEDLVLTKGYELGLKTEMIEKVQELYARLQSIGIGNGEAQSALEKMLKLNEGIGKATNSAEISAETKNRIVETNVTRAEYMWGKEMREAAPGLMGVARQYLQETPVLEAAVQIAKNLGAKEETISTEEYFRKLGVGEQYIETVIDYAAKIKDQQYHFTPQEAQEKVPLLVEMARGLKTKAGTNGWFNPTQYSTLLSSLFEQFLPINYDRVLEHAWSQLFYKENGRFVQLNSKPSQGAHTQEEIQILGPLVPKIQTIYSQYAELLARNQSQGLQPSVVRR